MHACPRCGEPIQSNLAGRVLKLTAGVFLLAAMVAFNSDTRRVDLGLAGTAAKVEFAFLWTVKAVGVVIVVLAAVQLVQVAARPDQAELVAPSAIALLGGLLLIEAHWSLGVVFGVVVVGWLALRSMGRGAAPTPPLPATGPQAVATESRTA
jgi:hypothetical protein